MTLQSSASRRWVRAILAIALLSAVAAQPLAGAAEPEPQLVPVNGFPPLVALDRGTTGEPVVRLQDALRERGFYRGPVDGEYGPTTETAVVTFHKYLDLDRTGDFSALDWIRLALLPPPQVPYRWDEPDRIEIDLEHQLLYVVRDHVVAGILPTSTGSGGTYYSVRNGRDVTAATPQGDFRLRWHETGWNCDIVTSWCVYNYWSFTPFYGIHGYHEVPTFPASHGCSRVHTWDSDWLESQLYVGMPVHVWIQPPPASPPPLQSAPRLL